MVVDAYSLMEVTWMKNLLGRFLVLFDSQKLHVHESYLYIISTHYSNFIFFVILNKTFYYYHCVNKEYIQLLTFFYKLTS